MASREISGVGTFELNDECWECAVSLLDSISVTVLQPSIEEDTEARLRWIADRWPTLLNECRTFIDQHKAEYGLRANSFTSPSIILSNEGWTVYFNTENEIDNIVAVEFSGDKPQQLIIGD